MVLMLLVVLSFGAWASWFVNSSRFDAFPLLQFAVEIKGEDLL